jgi:uncharacterized protein YdaT
MSKTYTSTGTIAFTLQVNGANRRISFKPKSFGGSTYTTKDKDEIKALEAHSYFGSVYTTEQKDSMEEPEKKTENASMVTVRVSDIADAKDYLVDTYGMSAGSLRSKKAIVDAAESKNIIFEGI